MNSTLFGVFLSGSIPETKDSKLKSSTQIISVCLNAIPNDRTIVNRFVIIQNHRIE